MFGGMRRASRPPAPDASCTRPAAMRPSGGQRAPVDSLRAPYRAGRPRGAEHAHQNLLPDGRSAAGRVCGMGTSGHRIQLAVPARANAPLGNDEATDPHDAGDPGPTGHEEASRATVIGGQRLPVHLLGDRRVALERLPRGGSRGPRATRRVLRRARNRQWSSASPGSRGRRAAPFPQGTPIARCGLDRRENRPLFAPARENPVLMRTKVNLHSYWSVALLRRRRARRSPRLPSDPVRTR